MERFAPGPAHWGATFFGELYRASTLPWLGAARTAAEVLALGRLLQEAPGPRTLDLGCGHGRHAVPLARAGLRLVGLDLDEGALGLASTSARSVGAPLSLVRGDLLALPFADSAFDAAYAWYSSLFLWTDALHATLLASIARTLRPGGIFLHQSVDPESLDVRPRAEVRLTLPGGDQLTERSAFDATTRRDEGQRTLVRRDGRVLEGGFSIRYYDRAELHGLLERAGFTDVRCFAGEELGLLPDQLVVRAVKGRGR